MYELQQILQGRAKGRATDGKERVMGIRQDQCNKVCRIIDDYLANRPRERDELIVAVRTVFKEADGCKTENSSEKPNNSKERSSE